MNGPNTPANLQAGTHALTPLSQETHLLDRLSVLFKYRRAAMAVFVLVVAWNMVDSYTTIPQYQAQSRVLIDEDTAGLGTPADISQNFTLQDPEVYLQTQLRIIRGRELARRTAKKLELHTVPEFNGQGAKPTALAEAISTVKTYAYWPVRIVLGSTPAPSPVATAESGDPEAYADALIGHLGVNQIRGSRLVDLLFTAADPAFAAKAANAYAEEYVAQNLELKAANLDKSLEWLTGEVGRQEGLVKASERALADYRERQDAGGLAEGSGNIVVARLTQLNDEVTRARTNRLTKENVWNQVRSAGQDTETITTILQNPMVLSLRNRVSEVERDRGRISERYGPRHPEYEKVTTQLADVKLQLEAEIKKAIQTAKSEYEAAVVQERTLTQALNEQKAAATDLSRKGVDYTLILREAESNREIYNSLLTREKELRVVANSRTNNIRLVDRAQVPGSPSSPNHRQDWIYALAFGLVFALGAAFGIDYLDDTVKTPEDITRRLKLRFLGLVPAVRGDRHPLLSGPVPHDFGEAFRTLRTALVSQLPGDGPKVMAVTSAQPLEGKTTTAVNIAMALAVGGSRVLLIDADMRRPSVHKALRMTNDRGLSQLLAGQARMREVVQRTHDPNLLVITAGRTPANPSELLAADRMRALISGLENGPFDWVIIDTPPVLAVTDAVIIAPLVAGVTFVVGSEMTRWRLAERAVETLLSGNPRHLCAVLNKVDFARNKYYYSRYYGHQYKSYYAEAPAA
ncbi:MAG: hypothetical protein A3J29_02580 [Acidobacteria bacterium RIFCSPLOWO2_12_FULL_67_14b]|nr:MAG: hypothetical protein A3J29_02580 [Acidobacteria bacterium RIFCSPLOWO2_12_FULL_67_14b]